jgi:hypothetical protein
MRIAYDDDGNSVLMGDGRQSVLQRGRLVRNDCPIGIERKATTAIQAAETSALREQLAKEQFGQCRRIAAPYLVRRQRRPRSCPAPALSNPKRGEGLA